MSKKINNEMLFRALSDVDDKYIEEALNYSFKESRAKVSTLRTRALIGSIAAIAVAVVGGIIIFNSVEGTNKTAEVERYRAPHNEAQQETVAAYIQDGAEEAAEVNSYYGAVAELTEDAIEEEVADSNFVNSIDIEVPSELDGITTYDYEFCDGLIRTSYFDANGELLLEINQIITDSESDILNDSGINYLESYEAVAFSDDITLYRDGEYYLGATVSRNDELFIIRTPLGVSEDTLQTIISQI